MRKVLLTLMFALPLTLQSSNPSDELCSGFVPENDLYIAADSKMASDMTKADFNALIDKVEAIYTPLIEAQGGTLDIRRKWSDGTVNASAQRRGNQYILNMYGGLARHNTVTNDGFSLVICHELGHHLGGAPKIGGFTPWASNEGQSDYFSSFKCLRQVFAGEDNIAIVTERGYEDFAHKACEAVYGEAPDAPTFGDDEPTTPAISNQDVAICIRAAMSGFSVATLFQALRNERTDPDFATPDSNVVSRTNNSHPATQCRLDTYLQGALCDIPVSEGLSDRDPNIGTCNRAAGNEVGIRPLCWYKP